MSGKRKVRKVDDAMNLQRPEKIAMRALWVAHFEEYNLEADEVIYLTLCGAEGGDIRALVDKGIITLTESGAIPDEWRDRIAAVESGNEAVYKLQKQFPGIKIFQQEVRSLLRGDQMLTFPEPGSDHRDACRARIVNLDLNKVLSAELMGEGEEVHFPVMAWIEKLGIIHGSAPNIDWSLFLTLHGEIDWNDVVNGHIGRFLKSNFEDNVEFEQNCRGLLGDDLIDSILADDFEVLRQLSRELQQKFLMILVPKRIFSGMIGQQWSIETVENLHYGNEAQNHAPMVSWILRLRKTDEAPAPNYRRNLAGICSNLRRIGEDGTLYEL